MNERDIKNILIAWLQAMLSAKDDTYQRRLEACEAEVEKIRLKLEIREAERDV